VGLGLALAVPARAQDQPRVRAQVDRLEMAEGEDLRLTVEIVGQGLDKVGPPDMSILDDFEVSGGPSVSTRYQWINGVSSSSKTYTFFLTPKRTGKLTVPSLGILAQGGTYRTQSIDVTVSPRGAVRSPMQPAPPIPRAGPGVGGPPRGRAPGNPAGRDAIAPAALRIRCEVDTKSAYVGQQVTLKVVLDTQTEVLNIGYQETPTFPGFWTEEVKLPDQLDVRRVQIDGEPWSEIVLMKRALFPTSAGTLTIPPVAWQIQVRRRSTDALESFFFTPTETVTRRSDPITITALPVPAAGRPPGFSGAVGDFNLSVVADRQASRVNDAIGVKVKVTGEGNLGAVQAPEIADLADFKLFEPKVSNSTTMLGDRLHSEKVWDYVVIPLAQGTQTVPPVRFTYFDPKAAAYRTISSQPLSVQVGKGEEGGGSSLPVVSQSDVRLLRRDIHYLKLAPDGLHDRSRPLYRTPLFAVLVLIPVVADLALFGWARTRDDSPGAARSRRERRARSAARRRLRTARRQMTPSTSRAFYASVAQAMTDYIGDKFGAAGAGLTHERIEELLASHGAAEDLRAAFHRCLEACDYARFAPSSSDAAAMQQTLTSAEETLVNLERTISR
jgi:hypothetical protein